MNTPIVDFVRKYNENSPARLHMPGHKGHDVLGFEHLDITEIDGADNLYFADGIIKESEENASSLFGCPTFYSTEGSSHAIRAMLYLCLTARGSSEGRPLVYAARNVHKTFVTACALLDLDVKWLNPSGSSTYHSCVISPESLKNALIEAKKIPIAVYVTSPDYLGCTSDISALANICHEFSVPLLVDNAHGAYLKFLTPSQHPIDLGADMCCDSAHKTLPVVTGGAYLHISEKADSYFSLHAKEALGMFGSTSPSYLIMQSLDAANPVLENYSQHLPAFIENISAAKAKLTSTGFILSGSEPMKIAIHASRSGFTGDELSDFLLTKGIISEFHDPDFLVLMPSLSGGDDFLGTLTDTLIEAFFSLPRQSSCSSLSYHIPQKAMSIRKAAFSRKLRLPVDSALGKICAGTAISCPPAVPIIVCGEIIDEKILKMFRYYGIKDCEVVDDCN